MELGKSVDEIVRFLARLAALARLALTANVAAMIFVALLFLIVGGGASLVLSAIATPFMGLRWGVVFGGCVVGVGAVGTVGGLLLQAPFLPEKLEATWQIAAFLGLGALTDLACGTVAGLVVLRLRRLALARRDLLRQSEAFD